MLNRLYLVINMFVFIFTYIHEIKTNEKKAIILKESEKEHMGGFGRRKGKGGMWNYNLKKEVSKHKKTSKYIFNKLMQRFSFTQNIWL